MIPFHACSELPTSKHTFWGLLAHNVSSDSFRLESFRPWNPYEKLHPLQKHLDACRYPSPVPLDATPSPAMSTGPTQDQTFQVLTSERHPLPVHPPVDVYVDGGPQSVTKVSRQPEMVDQLSPVHGDSSCLDFGDILQLKNVADSENIRDTPFDHRNAGPEPWNKIASHALRLSFTPDRTSLSEARTPTSMEAFSSDFTIDPAIFGESRSRSKEQNLTGPMSGYTTHRTRSPMGGCPLSKDDGRPRGERRHTPRPSEPGRSPKINKVSVVIDNRRKNKPGRLSRETNTTNASFPTIHAHSSALTAENRLQFLSWLFEGALSRCSLRTQNTATTSTETAESSSRIEDTLSASRFSRKGLPCSAEEGRLLVELKDEEDLAGAEVIRRFDQAFPGRSPGSTKCTGVRSSASGGHHLPKIHRECCFTYSIPRAE